MELRTYSVGEVFESSQGKTIVVEDISTYDVENGCASCCFRGENECTFARCNPVSRWDEKYVHFELFNTIDE